ncbi:hypothetical protein GH714_000268 [Hevea brasiliensis]|uniref:BRX domain-containing protein n=1 Tax=Hevea brasiliensis TaxID=3981 RepID=A0A6A6LAC6_HEVBR|nr:hypothetical protein GH714_000268 [Hevea brasiliensis]
MADLISYGNAERDIEQALIALKKGAHLLKYGRKGKPKFCPFRLSNDETTLIWISSSGEKSLKLASVSKIIPGQRTAVFQRYLRPEKDYLSFSLIYNNGKRSLDLICKNKVEAEVWIAGLKALISSGQGGRSKIDGWSDGGLYLDDSRDLTSNSASDSSISVTRDISSPDVSVSFNPSSSPTSFQPENSPNSDWSHVASDNANMLVKGSAQMLFGADVLLPRPLESNVVLDVHHIACGVRHAALVTRQGEVFTWGEESGGRLGHGVGKDVVQPRLIESLAVSTVDFVACGEFHTCAVTMTGELYTWGDGMHNAGLLGHGTDVSHWMPKRISGPLEGLQVASVACGPWHTALVTSTGKLFTFGDGTFGVLGHGDRENVAYPREVESLSGLRTIAVACGVWHTAAVVEVIVTQSSASVSSGKLFTWGDGDKNRLGHGDKEPRLKPTCVPALIDYNSHKIACGHSLTVGLTTSGQVFTMGSTVYGQLGNPCADGKLPCLVEDKLSGESVEEIACGAYHVAVLTSRNEVYTWGKGANGRLGHGDVEDRKTPTLVEALKDRHVKYIACGGNYTAAICLHKWVSGAEQSHSRKATKAALAPNPGKPYRVCDSCFVKLNKVSEGNNHNRKNSVPRLSGENKDRLDKSEIRLSKSALSLNMDLIKQLDSKAARQGKKADTFSLIRSTQAPSLLQLKDVVLSSAVDLRAKVPKPVLTPSSKFQVESLRQKCDFQELELRKSAKKVQEAKALAAEESSKTKAAKDVIKSLTAQLKEMAERLPSGVYDAESMRPYLTNGLEPNGVHYADANGERHSRSDSGPAHSFRDPTPNNGWVGHPDTRLPNGGGGIQSISTVTDSVDGRESRSLHDGETGVRSRGTSLVASSNQVEAEWIEQYEPGVYITLMALHDGTRDLKRVRFSRRRFGEHQAETWWSENRGKVYEKYNVRGSDKSSVSGQAARRSEGAVSSCSQP